MLIKRFYMSENSLDWNYFEAAGGRKRPPKINFRNFYIK